MPTESRTSLGQLLLLVSGVQTYQQVTPARKGLHGRRMGEAATESIWVAVGILSIFRRVSSCVFADPLALPVMVQGQMSHRQLFSAPNRAP